MKHLLICREYPPAPYAIGGIGTYALNIARLLAERGETVHVIGQRWRSAPAGIEATLDGRLVVHRVAMDADAGAGPGAREAQALFATCFPPQAFAYRAGLLAERLVEQEGIDVIEAQEWEAPLYYFLLRRALGLGPDRTPPCIVHIHSPTEFIVRHNAWDPGRPDFILAQRLETHTIIAADAWLCPSRFLAGQAEAHYGLGGRVHVIPLPLGQARPLTRAADVWKSGSILYVGRLEPRKGVLEWVSAAVRVAEQRPDVRFEFVGADLAYSDRRSVLETARRGIPPPLQSRFVFHGEQPPSELTAFLRRARIGVVPSRWENFPNTCVEAMGSGLPVLATRNGGMAEVIEDGRSGWLADRTDPDALAAALERALDTPPERLAEMGRTASEAICRICDDRTVADAHLAFRREVVRAGAARSLKLPASARAAAEESPARRGLAVIISTTKHVPLDDVVDGIAAQTMAPAAIVLAGSTLDASEARDLHARVRAPVFGVPLEPGANPRVAACAAVRAAGLQPVGYVFLDPHARPETEYLAAMHATLENCAGVGIVTVWGAHPDATGIGPCPAFPHQLLHNEVGGCFAVRAAALHDAGEPLELPADYDLWALVNSILAAGWTAVAFPGELISARRAGDRADRSPAHWWAWPRVLSRTPDQLLRHATSLLLLLESERARAGRNRDLPRAGLDSVASILRAPARQWWRVLRDATRRPGAAARHIAGRAAAAVPRFARRLGLARHREE